MRFAPSQGLPIALTQYAPGKQVWISGKCYTSGAIYAPMADDRFDAVVACLVFEHISAVGEVWQIDSRRIFTSRSCRRAHLAKFSTWSTK